MGGLLASATASLFLFGELDRSRRIKVAGVALIGIDVDFEFCCRAWPNQDIFHDEAAVFGDDFQVHEIAFDHSVSCCVLIAHVDVSCGPNHSLFEFHGTVRSDEHTAWRSLDVAAVTNRSVDAQRDCIGPGKFDLAEIAGWSKDPHVGQHSFAWPNDHHCFFGSVESVLVEVFAGSQFSARTK